MAFAPEYRSQVELLIRCLPALNESPCFVLKGGTAINLFYQDLPRLSVDIDLTYLPIQDRDTSLAGIASGLVTITEALSRSIPGIEITPMGKEGAPKLMARLNDVGIKIEPSPIMRGAIDVPAEKTLTSRAVEEFGITATTRCLSTQDLYGGKMCAALDRQHPRDIFDMAQYLNTQSLDDIRAGFIAYLCCHHRPMSDLLAPNTQPLDQLYATQFEGMSDPAVSLETLKDTQQILFDWVRNGLFDEDRAFLVSVKQGEPDYSLAPHPRLQDLPAFQWKLLNIQNMNTRKHKLALDKLKSVLDRN